MTAFRTGYPRSQLSRCKLTARCVSPIAASAPCCRKARGLPSPFRPRPVRQGLTASFGVTQWRPGETPRSLLLRADQLPHHTKAEGRNRVVQDRGATLPG